MDEGKESERSGVDGSQPALFVIGKGPDLKPYKTVRLAVSGDVSLCRLETAIVDTRDFQRLRRIKQLGATELVYPTALHTRFDHSLGTLSMASEMVRRIRENKHNSEEERQIPQEDEQLIRCLALLHDIGHVPYGHTIEDEFCIFPRHDKDEERTSRFLGKDSPIGRILVENLGNDLYERFMRIYKADKTHLEDLREDLYIHDLVNNTVCADLLDYLRRDCFFCNIVLDMEYRFLKYLYLSKDGPVKRVVVRLWKEGRPHPRRDVLSELIRLLDNRYLLGERVYFHHTKLIAGTMIAGAVQRAKTEGQLTKTELLDMGDESLLDKLEKSKSAAAKKLVSRIRSRNLWKRVHEHTRSTVEAEQNELRDIDVMQNIMRKWWESPQYRTEDEDNLASAVDLESGDVLFHCPDSEMAMKLAEMKVFWNGKLRPLAQCTDDPVVGPKLEVILKSHLSLWAIRVFANPSYPEKADAIVGGCQRLFTFLPDAKARFGRLFYKNMVGSLVRSLGLSNGLLHDEFEKREGAAIQTLLADTSAIRDRATITKIIKDAFTR
jgi:HD superfamily phosphohydrolase